MSISPTLPPQILPLAPVIGRTPAPTPTSLRGQYFHDRQSDLEQLGQSLQSGDLAGAQQEYSAIQTLAQNGPFDGNAFAVNKRQQDFNAIGQALQSGDLAGAQKAFAQLEATFTSGRHPIPESSTNQAAADPGPAAIININIAPAAPTASNAASTAGSAASSVAGTAATSATTPEIVINLGSSAASSSAEQINISLDTTSSGEQVTIGVGSQQSPNAQEFTFNLAQNNNEQIVVNLLGDSSATSPSSQTSGVNVVA